VTRLAPIVALALLQAARFEPVQPELVVAGATFVNAWADYDTDGDPDLFVGLDGAGNRLYRNDRGVFGDVAGSTRRGRITSNRTPGGQGAHNSR
jgi:hypothetical protein